MASEAEKIAKALSKRTGVLFDVAVMGNKTVPPDAPGVVIRSVKANGARLVVDLGFADEPSKSSGVLVVESPAGLVVHESGAVDIARAAAATFGGMSYEKLVAEAPAVRFDFK